jgi:hypothetical protein
MECMAAPSLFAVLSVAPRQVPAMPSDGAADREPVPQGGVQDAPSVVHPLSAAVGA